jgi:hypothetical protein
MLDRPIQGIVLLGLLAMFLITPTITNTLGSYLDTLPMRIAAVVIVLASLAYDKLIALGLFMVISAIYIQQHQNDLASITIPGNSMSFKDIINPKAMEDLEKGGHADESYDEMDFTSKQEDQENEFHASGLSIDEKHVLQNEGLGSRSQNLFPEDVHHADSLMHGNRNGSQE